MGVLTRVPSWEWCSIALAKNRGSGHPTFSCPFKADVLSDGATGVRAGDQRSSTRTKEWSERIQRREPWLRFNAACSKRSARRWGGPEKGLDCSGPESRQAVGPAQARSHAPGDKCSKDRAPDLWPCKRTLDSMVGSFKCMRYCASARRSR
jgi:hypothetical protein